MTTILSSPGLEGLWQMHWSYNGDARTEHPGAVHREHRGHADDRRRVDGAAARRRSGSRRGRNGSAGEPLLRLRRPGAAPPPTAAAPPSAAPAAPGRGRGNATGHTPAYWLKVSAQPDGSFTITNPRNGFSKTYGPRAARQARTRGLRPRSFVDMRSGRESLNARRGSGTLRAVAANPR